MIGWIWRDGTPTRVAYLSRGGRAIFEGDIDVGSADSIAPTREALTRRDTITGGAQRNVVTADLGRRWPDGIIPYVIEADFPDQQRVHNAIAHFQANTPGTAFQTRQSYDNDYIVFRRTDDPNICGQSSLGKVGGGQILLVNDVCGMGTVIHELGHAIGIWHEQSRCDRDVFVEILWDNIVPGRGDQFDAHCAGAIDLESYDEGSIMHYRSTAFGRIVNGIQLQTIRSRRGLDYQMGQSSALSTMDIYSINRMYQPYGVYDVVPSYPGGVPTFTWTASPHASGYSVNLITVYEEYNDYENTSTIYDASTDYVGFTTQPAIQDGQRTYTGSSRCVLYSSINGTASYAYYYEIVAAFPNGVVSRATRWPVEIAPATC